MKWGQQNQRFGTMRLREKKMKKIEKRNMIKCNIMIITKYEKMKILIFVKILENNKYKLLYFIKCFIDKKCS